MNGFYASSLMLVLFLLLGDVTSFMVDQRRPAFSADRLVMQQQQKPEATSIRLQVHVPLDDTEEDIPSNSNDNIFGDLWKNFQPSKQQQKPEKKSQSHHDPLGSFLQSLHKRVAPEEQQSSPLDHLGEFFQNLQQQQPTFPEWQEKDKSEKQPSPLDQMSEFFQNLHQQSPPKLELPAWVGWHNDNDKTNVRAGEEFSETPPLSLSDKDKEMLVIRGGTVHAAYQEQLKPVNTKKALDEMDIIAIGARFWGVGQAAASSTGGRGNGRVGPEIFRRRKGKRRSRRRIMAFMGKDGDHDTPVNDNHNDSDVTATITVPQDPTGPGIIKGAGKVLQGSAIDGFRGALENAASKDKKKRSTDRYRYNIDDMEETPIYTAYGRIPRPVAAPSSKSSATSPPESSPYGDIQNGWFWSKTSAKKKQQHKSTEEGTSDSVEDVGTTEEAAGELVGANTDNKTTTITTTTIATTMTTQTSTASDEPPTTTGELHDEDHKSPWSLPSHFASGAAIDVEATLVVSDVHPQTSHQGSAGLQSDATASEVKATRPNLDSPFNPLTVLRAQNQTTTTTLTSSTRNAGRSGSLNGDKQESHQPKRNGVAHTNSIHPNGRVAATELKSANIQIPARRFNLNELNDVQALRAKREQNNQPGAPLFQGFSGMPNYPRHLPKKSPPPASLSSSSQSPSNTKLARNNESVLNEIKRGKAMLKADYELLHSGAMHPQRDLSPQQYQQMNLQRHDDERQLRRSPPPISPTPTIPFMETLRRMTSAPKKHKESSASHHADPTTLIGHVDSATAGSATSSVKISESDLRSLSLRSSIPTSNGVSAAKARDAPNTYRPQTQLINSRRMREQQRLDAEERALAAAREEADHKAELALEEAKLQQEKDASVERPRRPLRRLARWMRKPSKE